jgi:hypothetical protein
MPEEGQHGGFSSSSSIEFSQEESEVLALLAQTRRVDKRWLDDKEVQRIRRVLDRLHNLKMLSLLRISKEVGCSYTKVWGLCRALGVPTRGRAEADRNSAPERSKRPKRPFDGTDEEKAYILGFCQGDLNVRQVSSLAIFVSSTTTHPAFAKLFHGLFERYGPVYQYPMYEAGKGYKWKLAVRLDNSFQFLLQTPSGTLQWARTSRKLLMNWLAGLIDSDGNINITHDGGYVRATVTIYNQDLSLLDSAKHALIAAGFHPGGPYLQYRAGTVTTYKYRRDMLSLGLERRLDVENLIKELPLRHDEKVRRRALFLSVTFPAKWDSVMARVLSLRSQIDAEVAGFLEGARKEYLLGHSEID